MVKTHIATGILLLALLAIARPVTADLSSGRAVAVHIINHGWHTGIIMPSGFALPLVLELGPRFPDAKYLEFGWGDKGFYQAEEITATLGIRALLWPTESVMHVVAIDRPPRAYFPDAEIITLCVPQVAVEQLAVFIARSFARDLDGSIIAGDTGLYGNSQFYAGASDYHLFKTCNVWTARGVQQAGVDIEPANMILADSLMDSLIGIQAGDGEACLLPQGSQIDSGN